MVYNLGTIMTQDYQYISPTTSPTTSPSSDQPKIATNDEAIRSCFSGTTPPVNPIPGQLYHNTAEGTTFQWDGAKWSFVFRNTSQNSVLNGIINVSDNMIGNTVLIEGDSTINFPQFSTSSPFLECTFTFSGTTQGVTTFNAYSGDTIYYNGVWAAQHQINTAELKNSIFKIYKCVNTGFILAGTTEGLREDLSNLSSTGYVNLFNLIYPLFTVFFFNSAATPPLHGQYGISWARMTGDLAVCTADYGNIGAVGGTSPVGGNVRDHALSPAEIPHLMSYGQSNVFAVNDLTTEQIPYSGGFRSNLLGLVPNTTRTIFNNSVPVQVGTTNTGGAAHTHLLDIQRVHIAAWYRVS